MVPSPAEIAILIKHVVIRLITTAKSSTTVAPFFTACKGGVVLPTVVSKTFSQVFQDTFRRAGQQPKSPR